MNPEMADFVRSQTIPEKPTLVPEITLQLATEITPLWQLTEERLKGGDLPPPFWAFAWPGGQGLARYILDHPNEFKNKRIMDFAAGSGIAAIAAAKIGAQQIMADDIDQLAQTAILVNAQLNNVEIELHRVKTMERPFSAADIIIVGDVCYQQAMATIILRWLHLCREEGVRILMR
jgi:predicted nicotinamide N-methyase